MKKSLALLLAAVMVIGMFAGCSKSGSSAPASSAAPAAPAAPAASAAPAAPAASAAPEAAAPAAANADDIADEMTSADGKYQIAFVTDVGQLKDKSFNQGTYDGVKLYAAAAGKSYKYYQPAGGNEATDDDRYDAMKLAAENGAEVIVCAGFMQGNALAKAAAEFTNVKFVFIDGWAFDGMNNITGISFKEEQCGYLAGYAAVMDGYTKLGFSGGGGGTNDACIRYGYGFVQGAEAAAAKKGVKVEMNYSWLHGSTFSASPDLQTMISGWYQNGTEAVFACGGSMFQSIAAAASAEDCSVIGVDVDQSYESTAVITSAMKGIGEAAQQALKAAESDSTWANFGGKAVVLGAKENAVGLPTATWSLTGWTVDEYNALFADIVAGKVAIDNAIVAEPASTANVTVNIVK